MNWHSPPPTAHVLRTLNESVIANLWPFDDELPEGHVGENKASRYAYHAVKQMWSLQHSEVLPRDSALALSHALKATLTGLNLPASVQTWVTMVEGLHHSVEGDHDMAATVIQRLQAADAPEHGHLPLACMVCAAFHDALLQLTRGQQAHEALRDRVTLLAPRLAALRPALVRLEDRGHQLGMRMNAMLTRVRALAAACAGEAPPHSAWLQLASDLTAPRPSITLAHGQLVSAWVLLAGGHVDRARVAFEALAESAQLLKWRTGRWLARYELDCIHHPHDAHPARCVRLEVPLQADDAGIAAGAMPLGTPSPLTRSERVEMAKAFVSQGLRGKLSVEAVARHCGVTTRTLSQDFGSVLGISPSDHITSQKMALAQQLLREGIAIKQVATEVGFDTVIGFVKAYVRVHGSPPSGDGG